MRRLLGQLELIRRAFANWRTVALFGLLWRHLPLPARELTLVTRRRTRLVVPLGRRAGALYPALEVFAFAQYAYDWDLGRAPQVVDIGAHVGAFTCWLAEQQPDLSVACFEPDPAAFPYLLRNLERIAATAQPCAVGARGGTAALSRPIPAGSVSSLQPIPGAPTVTVDVVSFDEVMKDFADVSLLKLDCEGSEYEIVLDTSPGSWEHTRRVVIEYHPVPSHEPSELVERLERLGLRLLRERAGGAVGTYWFARSD